MKVGLIGCGGIAPYHVQVYQSMKNVKVVSVCDLDLKKAKNLAAKFQIGKTFKDYWNMFEKENLDLVDICTPVSTHARIVCDATEKVPAILVEKPMAINVSECEEIIREVKKHGSKFCVSHAQIFSPHIKKAKALVDSEEFDLFSFRTTQKESFERLRAHNLVADWNVTPKQRGIIWEVCCHLAYLQLHFLPNISEVYAVGGKVKYPVYDDFAVLLRTPDQRFGMIELSWVAKETEIVYELRDTEGRQLDIYRDFDYSVEKIENPPLSVGDVLRDFFVDEKRILQKWAKFGLSYIHKRKLLPTYNLITAYIESIKNDLPPPVSAEDGRNTIYLLECIKKALDEQRPVALVY